MRESYKMFLSKFLKSSEILIVRDFVAVTAVTALVTAVKSAR
jgi:hypothetical protein